MFIRVHPWFRAAFFLTALAFAPSVRADAAGGPPPKSEWTATASGAQEEAMAAAMACDGRLDTRWSSPWSDPHWLAIDLGRTATVCGVTLSWEDAYSTRYAVRASADGETWRTLFDVRDADGGVDDLYCRPAAARWIRIEGLARGTSWGHSLWEVDVKGPDDYPRVRAPSAEGCDGSELWDGRADSIWRGGGKDPVSVVVDLRAVKRFGGLRIDWGENYAARVAAFLSEDGTNWTRGSGVENGRGRFDHVFHPRAETRFIRLDLSERLHADRPVEIAELSLRGPDEAITPLTRYQFAAEKAAPGHYPEWLRRRQVYWTLVGLPEDDEESLLDEYGNLEPFHGGTTLMPYLQTGGRLLSALDADRVEQSLVDGHLPLPLVAWEAGGLRMRVRACAVGEPGRSATLAEYEVSNRSRDAVTGRVLLVVRPVQINPPWQQGGLSSVTSLALRATGGGGMGAWLDGALRYLSLTPPTAAGAQGFDDHDIAGPLADGLLPPDTAVSDEAGLASAAFAYAFDLAPGAATSIVVAAPLHAAWRPAGEERAPGETFAAAWDTARTSWREALGRVAIELPDRDLVDTLKAQLAYILLNRDGPSIQPGSRNYERSWIRDGSVTAVALLRLGHVGEARAFIDWYAAFVEPDGLVHHIMNRDGTVSHLFTGEDEWDSQGEFVYAVMEYYRFTKDRTFLERHFDAVVRALQFQQRLRERTLVPGYMEGEEAPERFVGILPKSISHEGYIPAVHSYWDDFWALQGWKDGATAAEILGRKDVAAWATEQYGLLRDALSNAVCAAIRHHGIDFVPGCAEKGDFDPTSTAIAFHPCREEGLLPERELRRTFDRFHEELAERLEPGWSGQFVPYEIRSVPAFVALGEREKAHDLMRYLMSCRRPHGWKHWVELYVADPRVGTYVGDMPHTWVGSGFANALRGMLAREEGDRLHLLDGAPEAWVADGGGVRVARLPTHFGRLDMTARYADKKLTVQLAGDVAPPGGLVVHWPVAGSPARVVVDGAALPEWDADACRPPAGTRTLVAEW